MKKNVLVLLLGMTLSISFGQELFVVPEITNQIQMEQRYNHMVAYLCTGIHFAKSKAVAPVEYGRFIGRQFTGYWNPEAGFPSFVNGLLTILGGIHPDNELFIKEQSAHHIVIQLKNIDMAFKEGPYINVSFDDYLECSRGVFEVLAEHMKGTVSHHMAKDGLYVLRFDF